MIVGVPKEIKPQENRVGLVPAGARALVGRGHRVLVEKGAGLGSGIPDAFRPTPAAPRPICEYPLPVARFWEYPRP